MNAISPSSSQAPIECRSVLATGRDQHQPAERPRPPAPGSVPLVAPLVLEAQPLALELDLQHLPLVAPAAGRQLRLSRLGVRQVG
jgi:hypothetical protein